MVPIFSAPRHTPGRKVQVSSTSHRSWPGLSFAHRILLPDLRPSEGRAGEGRVILLGGVGLSAVDAPFSGHHPNSFLTRRKSASARVPDTRVVSRLRSG